ncbi:hypothetical protein RCO27_03360 [Sphingosinicella sp. LHD-64]|uniref:hypothetical protein n=1 Tax=Sphingosinicella sp. LHD-64 TaxID=3072139 RepID=UPI00280D2793|nr:hypothetical protein [Sphingosinicella sp. LHD-64]MDQ8755260.1 hypothetical protein [Sphingosinicella sp. LHD-64]
MTRVTGVSSISPTTISPRDEAPVASPARAAKPRADEKNKKDSPRLASLKNDWGRA